jgi:hypothetical protein
MKICRFGLILSVSIAFMSCITAGNGDITMDERALSPFKEITASGSTEVRFHAGTEYRAVVTADSNLIDQLETVVRGDVLIIRHRFSKSVSFTREIVDVYCPSIEGVTMSGSGHFEAGDKIATPVFRAKISGSGSINGTLECNKFSARISGSGKMNITGSSQEADIVMSGSGDFLGSEFRIKDCSIEISGSGGADIFAEDNLKGRSSGSGRIRYRGNPKFVIRSSGSGSVEKVD